MIRYFRGDRLYFAIEGADGADDESLAEMLASVDERLASLPPSVALTISGDPRRLRPASGPNARVDTPSAPAQPSFLERVDLAANDLVFSPVRERLINELTTKSNSYFLSRTPAALTLLLDGPPGTGKSTIAREVARRVGVETFRPSSKLQTKYVGETAGRIADMFGYLRSKRAILIWDDLDRLFSDRGYEVDSASREHRDILASVFTALDETRVVIIGSTNAKGVLDDAFVSRVTLRKALPAVDTGERRELLRKISSRSFALTNDEIQEVVEAAPWMSFRDIETFCRSVSETSLPIPRIVEAWRNTFADRVVNADWSRPQPAELRATSRIWDVDVADAGHTAWIGAKDDRAFGASILAHGQLAQMNQILRDDDVNSVCYDRTRDLLLLGTDKELCVVKNARAKRTVADRAPDVVSLRTVHGDVWDARWISDELILVAYNDGTIAVCRYDGTQIVGDLSVTKAKGCRNVRWIGSRSKLDFFVVGCGQPVFPIIRVDRGVRSVLQVGQLPYPEKDLMPHRRVATLPRGQSSSFIAVPSERGVSVYQWSDGAETSLAANIAAKDCRACTFDLASPRFAMTAGDEIHVFSSFMRASMENPRVIKSESTVTAMCFGRFGQSLIWGTEDGGIFSATTIVDGN